MFQTADDLKNKVSVYRHKRNTNVKRSEKSYTDCRNTVTEELERLIKIYQTEITEEDMRARLIRDCIDYWVRRYHGYAIKENIKSHYNQRGVSLKPEHTVFEHIIPMGQVREMLLAGDLTIPQALNVPTCRVSRDSNKLLNDRGMHDRNADPFLFFKRYKDGMSITVDGVTTFPEFETYNGIAVDIDTWNLWNHYQFFNIN